MPRLIFTTSNLLSFLRILFVIPITILLIKNDLSYRWQIFTLSVIAALTDTLDGYFARKFNQITELGKILDPLADKIGIAVVTIALVIIERIPVWLLVIVILRDILILAGGIYIKKVKGIILQSDAVGKSAVTILAMFMLMVILDLPGLVLIKEIFLVISTVMLFVSFYNYYRRFILVINN